MMTKRTFNNKVKRYVSIALVLVLLLGMLPLNQRIQAAPIATGITTPTPSPAPDTGPYIRVTTPFPTGVVTRSFVDINYIARAGYGEDIVMITFLTNNSFYGTIYYIGSDYIPPIGILGEARVFIVPGRNHQIEFTLVDSAGDIATHVVSLDVTLNEGFHAPPLCE